MSFFRLFTRTRSLPGFVSRHLTVTPNNEALASFLSRLVAPPPALSPSSSPLPVTDLDSHLTSAKGNDTPGDVYARIDHSRSTRTGFPEVIYGEGKTAKQVTEILKSMGTKRMGAGGRYGILATRVRGGEWREIQGLWADDEEETGTLVWCPESMVVTLLPPGGSPSVESPPGRKTVLLVTAGTTDVPIALEAKMILEASGAPVTNLYDCGVAGLHRIVKEIPTLTSPDVGCVVVFAGMDGALPSVVAGLVPTPVIACPTSVGYGASFQGISAMLTMLNSCAPGVVVVNVDNGFGAAAAAFKIIKSGES